MDHLARTLVFDGRVARRQTCELGALEVAPDDAFDRKAAVAQRKRLLKKFFSRWRDRDR